MKASYCGGGGGGRLGGGCLEGVSILTLIVWDSQGGLTNDATRGVVIVCKLVRQ